ncbi:hypothetical protein FGO68_gene11945 [Halteria grandinella]|uniref:C2H2-type domain-containing protein n=1 Tax=Halteria grandinella TaxID=5974 RepID=A0A8J8NU00_HALGN|nr:hypothetical protein FGO68_gene11945 [Halteria grandinella]
MQFHQNKLRGFVIRINLHLEKEKDRQIKLNRNLILIDGSYCLSSLVQFLTQFIQAIYQNDQPKFHYCSLCSKFRGTASNLSTHIREVHIRILQIQLFTNYNKPSS